MSEATPTGAQDAPGAPRYYHGTRADLEPGDRIPPQAPGASADSDGGAPQVLLTPDLDAAIWAAELAEGEAPARVYVVEPTGPVEDAPVPGAGEAHARPGMAHRSRQPLRVAGEVTDWTYYHGTRADLRVGDAIAPGHTPNYGDRGRRTSFVYLTRTLDAAIWGAELAAGDGPERIYTVEPTGPIEDDPNVTNARFRGNPTQSFRTRAPLRVTGELRDWQGHAPEALAAMREGLARLEREGIEPIDD